MLNVHCAVTIGDRVLIGASVQMYTRELIRLSKLLDRVPDLDSSPKATHPVSPEARNGSYGREAAKPIVICDDVWSEHSVHSFTLLLLTMILVGGSAIILAGITVGKGSVVAAGAVVVSAF